MMNLVRSDRWGRVSVWLAVVLLVMGTAITVNTYRADQSIRDRRGLHDLARQLVIQDEIATRERIIARAKIEELRRTIADLTRRIETLEGGRP